VATVLGSQQCTANATAQVSCTPQARDPRREARHLRSAAGEVPEWERREQEDEWRAEAEELSVEGGLGTAVPTSLGYKKCVFYAFMIIVLELRV